MDPEEEKALMQENRLQKCDLKSCICHVDDMIPMAECNHNVCKECFDENVDNLASLNFVDDIRKCPVCLIEIPSWQLERLLTSEILDKIVLATFKNPPEAVDRSKFEKITAYNSLGSVIDPTESKFEICILDRSMHISAEILTLDGCGHNICFECFYNIFEKSMAENMMHVASACPYCFKNIPYYQLETLISEKDLNKIKLNPFINSDLELNCPKCRSINVSCIENLLICLNSNCGRYSCKKCREVYHELDTCPKKYPAQSPKKLEILAESTKVLDYDQLEIICSKSSEEEKKAFKTCMIDYETYSMDKIINLMMCDHYICESCFQKNINALVSENKIDLIKQCPICSVELSPFELESLFTKDLLDKLNNTAIYRTISIITCPGCKEKFEPNPERKVICIRCDFLICKYCQERYHEADECEEGFIEEKIKELEANIDSGGITQCPRCRVPYTKDEKCERVTCINSSCNTPFCFKCACLMSPVLAHGNHYHRPECDLFRNFNGADNYSPNTCEACKKSERICARPKSLKVKKRVSPSEAII